MLWSSSPTRNRFRLRAAWPQALLEFQTVYPEVRVLLMETNYRSTRSIVAKADAFIQRNQSRHAKHMTTDNPQGEPIRVVELEDYSRQYRYLLRLARECSRSTAILYRNNDSALPLIDLLEREGVPYRCRQRESYFFSSPVVRDLTDMLRFALDGRDAERFLRFYYKLDLRLKRRVLQDVLARYGGDASVLDVLLDSGQIEPWQAGRLRALRTHFSKLPALGGFAALQRIVKYMGYGDYLSARHADAARVNILLSLARQSSGIQGLLDRLDALQRVVEGPERYPDCPLVPVHHPLQQGAGVRPGGPDRRDGRRLPRGGRAGGGGLPLPRGAGGPGGGAAAVLRRGHPGQIPV